MCCFSCLLLCDLAFQYLSSFCNCFVDLLRILSAGLCHVRTSTAATANDSCYCFDQISCMSSCFLGCICCHCKEIYLTAVYCCKKDNTFAKLLFQLVTKISQAVHINAINFGCKEFYAVYFNDFIHNITKCTLSCFALEGLVLALKCFYLRLKMADFLYYLRCISL